MVKILYIIIMKSSDSGASFPQAPEFCSPPGKKILPTPLVCGPGNAFGLLCVCAVFGRLFSMTYDVDICHCLALRLILTITWLVS